MPLDPWAAVDQYHRGLFVESDPVLDEALRAAADAGLPAHGVSPSEGLLLSLLVRAVGARRVLEIGTLAGYSTIWLARALPAGGRVITLEADPSHAAVAEANIARAGLSDVVQVRVGRALETLPLVAGEDAPPFDLIFIDADKQSNAEYFTWSLRLSHPGTLIVADNVVRSGQVANPSSDDPHVQGIRHFNELVAAEPRVTAAPIQTVGSKGWDGFTLILVDR